MIPASFNPSTQRALRVARLGLMEYGRALALQQSIHADVVAGRACDTLLLVEHPPTITLGRNSGDGHVLWSAEALAKRAIARYETGRGGDVTYHAPGQLVAYPIVALQDNERDVRAYVSRLEAAVIATLADFGVTGDRVAGLRGVWVGNNKIAAIGVRIARWATLHGLALNVDLDLAGFACIVACGLRDRGVTSMAQHTPAPAPMAQVQTHLARHLARVLQRHIDDCRALDAVPCAPAVFSSDLRASYE